MCRRLSRKLMYLSCFVLVLGMACNVTSADVLIKYDANAGNPQSAANIQNPSEQGWVETGLGASVTVEGIVDNGTNAWRIVDDTSSLNPQYTWAVTADVFQAMYDQGWTYEFVTRGVSAGFTGWGLTTTTDPGWGLTTRERVGFGIGVSGDAFSISPIHGNAVTLAPGSASDFHTIRCVGKAQSSEYEFSIDGVSYGMYDIKDGSSNSSYDNVFRFVSGSTAGAGRETLWNFVGLGTGELRMLAPPELAAGPTPSDAVIDVPCAVTLNWIPGEFANTHDVYFGTSFDDVNNATNLDSMGLDNVYRARQGINSYAVPERLDFGETYYWRIDEVNAPPTSHVVFKGNVWSFTAEPFAVSIHGEGIAVTASSANRAEEGPENTVNGSGLDDDDLHSVEQTDMWLSSGVDPNATWIQYEFDRLHKLYQMWIWNYNTTVEPLVGFGIRQATIEYSVDGTDWSKLGTTHEFAKGPGASGYMPNTIVDLGGMSARYVRITADNNWGDILNQFGLSEVRFLYIPVWAREPSPDSGATDVGVDVTLSFRAGREAAKHDVYLGTNEQAVIDGTAPVTTVTEPTYAFALDLAGTYYWRVDEVNDAEIPTTWQGDIWNVSTQEYLVVDEFESYNDIAAGEEGSNLIYLTWADGFENPANGSTIGYNEPFQPTMETSIIHDGKQSVLLSYDNTVATYSEVTADVADLQAGQDWTRHDIKALTLRFFGDPDNNAQQMYVKINGTRVPYDGDAENLKRTGWQMWYIDLASTGVSLSNVAELAIGFERIGALGGQGVVYVDGIRLYSYDRQLITPAEPDPAGLQAHYEFEGTTNDSSGNARNGTAMGNPVFEAGKLGQAMSFDGLGDYVNISGYKGITATNDLQPAFSIACWLRTNGDGTMVSWGSGSSASIGGQYVTFRIDGGRLRSEHGNGNLRGNTYVNDGNWHHCALTVVEGGNLRVPNTVLYVDGREDTVFSDSNNIYNLTADADVSIGRQAHNDDRYIIGSVDDVRIYDRVLSEEEIASLSGRTKAFDKPF